MFCPLKILSSCQTLSENEDTATTRIMNMPAITTQLWLSALLVGSLCIKPAYAETINYTELFRTKALGCIHPTVNLEKATVEMEKDPSTTGEVTTARIKVYYEGWMKKQVMESDLMVRQAGSIRQMRVAVLSDSGSAHAGCALEKNWSDF
jgi:hypothetical protein